MSDARLCAVAGCDRPYRAKGLCGMHYARKRRHGDPRAIGLNHLAAIDTATMSALGANVQTRRIQLGMSIMQLVKASGVSRATIWRLNESDFEARLSTIRALAAALRCEDWELLRPNTFTKGAFV